MTADGLTKALPRQKHETFVQQLNLVDIKDLIWFDWDDIGQGNYMEDFFDSTLNFYRDFLVLHSSTEGSVQLGGCVELDRGSLLPSYYCLQD